MLVGLRARLAVTMTACSIAWLVTSLAAGCSQLLDVREPIVRDDAGVPDGTSPNDGPDPDAADIPRLWLVTTKRVLTGQFLAPGGRPGSNPPFGGKKPRAETLSPGKAHTGKSPLTAAPDIPLGVFLREPL